MKERWINPVAWSPRLVDHLVAMGWKALQLDLESGSFSEETIAWILASTRAKGLDLVVRVPVDQTTLVTKLAKDGARIFLVPGVQSAGALARYVEAARNGGKEVRVVPMVETLTWMRRVPELAMDGVSGVHYGIVDLCRDLGIDEWRDVRRLHADILDSAKRAAACGLTVGTYMLPQWRDSEWPDHFDVHSFALPEFAALTVPETI